MAWMVAYNEGLLDALPSSEIPVVLRRLAQWVSSSGLSLEDKHEEWTRAVRNVLASHQQPRGNEVAGAVVRDQ